MSRRKKMEKTRQSWRSTLAVLLLALPLILTACLDLGVIELGGGGSRPIKVLEDGTLKANNAQLKQAFETVSQDVFYEGVYIDGISLSGMTRDQGIAAVQKKAMDYLAGIEITLEADGQKFKIGGGELGASYNISDAVNEAWAKGRTAVDANIEQQVLKRYQEVEALKTTPFKTSGKMDFNQEFLREALENKLAAVTVKAEPAHATSFDIHSAVFEIAEKVDGKKPNIDDTLAELQKLIDKGDLKGTVKVKMEPIDAGETAAEVASKLGLRGEATTYIYAYGAERDANLARAAQLMDGVIINPGETFSYLNTMGDITYENGFYDAPTLINGQLENEVGGGLCQPSTTIFQAAMNAGLGLGERYEHGKIYAYYQGGMDAMVMEPWADFTFHNTTNYPVAIYASFSPGESITFRIYGEVLPDGVTYELYSEKVGQNDPTGEDVVTHNPNLKPGERKTIVHAASGEIWDTYRLKKLWGETVETERLFRSTYATYENEIEVGPELPPGAKPAETPAGDTPAAETPPAETTAEAETSAP